MTGNRSIREKRRAWDKLGAARAKEFRDAQAAAQAEAMLSAIEIEIKKGGGQAESGAIFARYGKSRLPWPWQPAQTTRHRFNLLSEWAKAGVIQRAVISKGRYGRTSVVRWVSRK